MSHSFPCLPYSTESAMRLGSYARLSDDTAGEGSSSSMGSSGRWADALLKNKSHGVASASSAVRELESQFAHRPLSPDGSWAANTVASPACAPPRQRRSEATRASQNHHDNSHHCNSLAIGVAPPRAFAVAVHPPLPRGAQRAISGAAPAHTSGSSATASVTSHTSTKSTAPASAILTSYQPLNQGSVPLPRSFMTAAPAGPSHTSALFAVQQNGCHPPKPAVNTVERRSTRDSAPAPKHVQPFQALPHTQRGEGTHNGSGGSSSGGVLTSAATPYPFPATYASSPFFQRVDDTAPPPQSLSDVPHAAASMVRVTAQDDENPMLQLQDITPITNTGDSRQESQLLSHSRAAPQMGGDSGLFTYDHETANRDGGAGATPAVSFVTAGVAAGGPLPFPGVGNAVITGDAPPWSTLPHTQPPLCSATQVLSRQQPMFSPCERIINQSVSAEPFSKSASPSDTARLPGTPGGLSTSQSVTMCSTGKRRRRGGVSATAAHNTAMSSTGPLTSPESVSRHFSAIYASSPPSSSAYASGRDQCSSTLLTPGSNGPSFQTAFTASSSPSAYACAPQQYHLPCQQYPIDGFGDHGGPFPPSHLTATPLSTWAPGPGAACATTMAMTVGQVQGSASATAISAQDTAGGTPALSAIARSASGVSLEKRLLHASRAELTQVLLELARCNWEASRFIHSKAFFFAFRHKHGGEAVESCEGCAAAASATTARGAAAGKNGEHHAYQDGLGSGALSKGVDMPNGDRPREQSDVLKQPAAEAATLSSAAAVNDHIIARCIFPMEAADDEDGDGDDSSAMVGHPDPTVTEGGTADATMPQRHPCSEDRAFSTELHPCLRWYGACRNTTSCIYANVPRNVCLNWIRGSCMTNTECNGVHRLPSPCPPEIRRIYELNHGLACRGTPAIAYAIGASFGHALPIPPPFPPCISPAPAPFSSGSVAAAAPENSNADALAAELAENCAGANAAFVMCGGMTEELGESEGVVHTPKNQSIQKDTFLGGDSTPHRRQQGCDVEQSISSTTTLEKCGANHATTTGDASLWDSYGAATKANAGGPVDHEMMQYTDSILGAGAADPPCFFYGGVPLGSRKGGMVSSAGSSRCSTAEGCESRLDSVSRYLGPQLDRAATTVPHCDDGWPDSAVIGSASQQQQADAKSINSICRCIFEAKGPFHVVPARHAGDMTGTLADAEDECDFSVPTAGTRTRVQSPLYR
nr:unnamed protein product [Leishmania braziliensis]